MRQHKKPSQIAQFLERTSRRVTQAAGSSNAFALAVLVIIAWLVTGPIFHYSDTCSSSSTRGRRS